MSRLLACSLALSLLGAGGCVLDGGDSWRDAPSSPPNVSPPTPTDPPPKVAIDVGPNLTSEPGAGAGIFVSYGGAGRWSIAWTCDSNTSQLPCQFDLDVRSTGIHAATATAPTSIAFLGAEGLAISQSTSTTLERVSFAADLGASVVLTAKIDGRAQPELVFYVSNGRIVSAPTDPIELVPASP